MRAAASHNPPPQDCVREDAIVHAVECIERYVLHPEQTTENLRLVDKFRASCILARFASAHFQRFSATLRQRLDLLHDRLRDVKAIQCSPSHSGLTPVTRLLSGLWGELEAMRAQPDPRGREVELAGWEVLWVQQGDVTLKEVSGWLRRQRHIPSIQDLRSEAEAIGRLPLPMQPTDSSPEESFGPLEERLLNATLQMVYALIEQVDWRGVDRPDNPIFDKIFELSQTLGKRLVYLLAMEMMRSGGSPSHQLAVPKLALKEEELGDVPAPARPCEERELLAYELTDFSSRFIMDYVLGLSGWENGRAGKALADLIPLALEFVIHKYLLPILDQRPRSLTREWHEAMVQLLDAANTFLEDYHEAYEAAQKADPFFSRSLTEEQEIKLLKGMREAAASAGRRLPSTTAATPEELRRHHQHAVQKLLQPYLEEALPLMPKALQELHDDFPNALSDLIVTVANVMVNPHFTTRVMERGLDYLLPTLLGALESDGTSPAATANSDFGTVEARLGGQIRRAAVIGLKLGGAGGWLKGAMLIGKRILSRFEKLIGRGVHRAIDGLISQDTLYRIVGTATKLFWRPTSTGMEPVFSGCFSLNEEQALKLKLRVEERWQGVLHQVIRGAAAQSSASLALVNTDAVKKTCDTIGNRVFDVLWQPQIVRLFIYDYLLPKLETLKAPSGGNPG
ncbi:MAG: hypothetical protein KDK78_04285 [Chlamydiia bacterium]|nr:hypothetical protein [Chlamydiia bacterium]